MWRWIKRDRTERPLPRQLALIPSQHRRGPLFLARAELDAESNGTITRLTFKASTFSSMSPYLAFNFEKVLMRC
jgi:hypothetical protein